MFVSMKVEQHEPNGKMLRDLHHLLLSMIVCPSQLPFPQGFGWLTVVTPVMMLPVWLLIYIGKLYMFPLWPSETTVNFIFNSDSRQKCLMKRAFVCRFVIFAKRIETTEARLRVFCMTDDREEKTLEGSEHDLISGRKAGVGDHQVFINYRTRTLYGSSQVS